MGMGEAEEGEEEAGGERSGERKEGGEDILLGCMVLRLGWKRSGLVGGYRSGGRYDVCCSVTKEVKPLLLSSSFLHVMS